MCVCICFFEVLSTLKMVSSLEITCNDSLKPLIKWDEVDIYSDLVNLSLTIFLSIFKRSNVRSILYSM